MTRGDESSTLDMPLSKLFPNLFSISRPIITPEVPVIVAASILTTYESPIIPIPTLGGGRSVFFPFEKQGVKLFKAIASQQIIHLLIKSKPSDYYKILWNPCTTTSIWLGALEYHDSLERLLRIFELTGFGNARVNATAPPHALITLDEVASLYRERKLKCKLEVKEIASRAIFVDPDTMLMEAMRMMCEKRVRRLFLRGREGEFVSDRKILAFLFSPKALTVARDAPEFWTEVKVSDIQSMKARPVSPHAKVEDAGRKLEAGRDVFWLSDEASLVSKWDLVMRPWRAKQLSLSL